jgi:hypothetical protein
LQSRNPRRQTLGERRHAYHAAAIRAPTSAAPSVVGANAII